ncbi:MAG: hypothetical protein AVDCRST_MAG45-1432 [uncultured Solirubrobacterales bacterium]|uniref:Uncharacterized protein n=1 Tax=uncultured Solirubrobacterales bacterium TaxID=768556 RepID=A0A6J4SR45_9ACTN|nr:MAG: hypothetical protein AVDCRST_MAG45-1432 [uncultured Solirubrobacterales bacterium]
MHRIGKTTAEHMLLEQSVTANDLGGEALAGGSASIVPGAMEV